MHKLTFKNKHSQKVEVHGKVGAIVFIPNEGDLIVLKKSEFIDIKKLDEK